MKVSSFVRNPVYSRLNAKHYTDVKLEIQKITDKQFILSVLIHTIFYQTKMDEIFVKII